MLIHNNFRSWCLEINTDVNIFVPDLERGEDWAEHFNSGKKYPVLWLLHGTWGGYTDFIRRTNIDLYAKERDIIVVMPNGLNTEYSNWDGFNLRYHMFDHLTKELMPMIWGMFPASNKREDNFICGLSMGAKGAFQYAINYPELFSGCACMSGTPTNIKKKYEEGTLSDRTLFRIKTVGGIDKFLGTYEDLWAKAKESVGKNLPDFYICCGTEDFLYEDYLAFKDYAKEIGFEATFEELDGYGHEWRFWDLQLEKILDYFGLYGERNITVASDLNKVNPSNL